MSLKYDPASEPLHIRWLSLPAQLPLPNPSPVNPPGSDMSFQLRRWYRDVLLAPRYPQSSKPSYLLEFLHVWEREAMITSNTAAMFAPPPRLRLRSLCLIPHAQDYLPGRGSERARGRAGQCLHKSMHWTDSELPILLSLRASRWDGTTTPRRVVKIQWLKFPTHLLSDFVPHNLFSRSLMVNGWSKS